MGHEPHGRSITEAVARYAPVVHGLAPDDHHVASPLGAWLVLALAGLADGGGEPQARTEAEDALGCPLPDAARAARTLLEHPHPAVAAAAALWWHAARAHEVVGAYC